VKVRVECAEAEGEDDDVVGSFERLLEIRLLGSFTQIFQHGMVIIAKTLEILQGEPEASSGKPLRGGETADKIGADARLFLLLQHHIRVVLTAVDTSPNVDVPLGPVLPPKVIIQAKHISRINVPLPAIDLG